VANKIAQNVQTQAVGFAPILRYYFEKCGIESVIDENVELDPRRKILTHGQATIAMITGILFQVMALYRICKFASEKNVLQVILPMIKPEQYFDDRLADTLDALFDVGIGNLDLLMFLRSKARFAITTPRRYLFTARPTTTKPTAALS